MEIKRSVLLPYSAADMFDLIEQAEKYPQFLPWCVAATILERSDDWVAARIEFSYLRIRFGFQTRNAKKRPDWLKIRMVEGPFRNFLCDWHLVQLGSLGCKINFSMSFDIADGRLDAIAAPAAGIVAKAMVEAFVKRAAATLKEVAQAQESPAAPVQTASSPPQGGAVPAHKGAAMAAGASRRPEPDEEPDPPPDPIPHTTPPPAIAAVATGRAPAPGAAPAPPNA